MVATWVVVGVSVAYLGVLFAIAWFGDRRAARGRSVISNGYIYALSIAVYATSWTYYGSVGSAAEGGIAWLPIYLGPMVVVILWWVVLRKIIRICKRDRITSLADFVSSRYGKSQLLGGLVTVIAVLGLVPYIALQLKAISTTFTILRHDARPPPPPTAAVPLLQDTGLYAALLLAAFTIVFGTRHLDATERHEGMVAAIAFESLVKLVAFLVVGAWVTYGLFDGFSDVVARAAERPELAELLTLEPEHRLRHLLLAHRAVDARLPAAAAAVAGVGRGERRRAARPHGDVAVPALPAADQPVRAADLPRRAADLRLRARSTPTRSCWPCRWPTSKPLLALLVFVGGLSAATGMVIVETIALSTMVSNSLVMPLLLRSRGALRGRGDLGRLVLLVRRVTIVVLLLLGFVYFRVATDALGLVQIGLISFAAVAQFAPAVLGGLYWKGATRSGRAVRPGRRDRDVGLHPAAAVVLRLRLDAADLPEQGPFGIELLAPYALFGLDGLDPVGHAMLWSMLANVGVMVGVSLFSRPGPVEHVQAAVFVDAMRRPSGTPEPPLLRGEATVGALRGLLERFVGPQGARAALSSYAARTRADVTPEAAADAELIRHVETLLAGSVGSASARVMVSSVVSEEPLGMSEVMEILDEASQVRSYSRALEAKSRELEQATAELREANEQLQELDRLKDDFVSTVTHELRTPLTSIRAFSEILVDNPDLDAEERQGFLVPIVEETERLTRLINQVLDLAKLESGAGDWQIGPVDLRSVVEASVSVDRPAVPRPGRGPGPWTSPRPCRRSPPTRTGWPR